MTDEKRLRGVRYLLTFRPFGSLPQAVRRAYLAGELHLLPFPGQPGVLGCAAVLAIAATNCPWPCRFRCCTCSRGTSSRYSLRVPQSGWMHEPHPDHPEPDPDRLPLRNTYRRTHRWARLHRHEDELAVADGEDRVAHVLFSTAADDVGLYGKPMARNAQIWTHDFRLLLDGPRADGEALGAGRRGVARGRTIRLPLSLPGDAGRAARGLLASAAGGLSRRGVSAAEVLPHAPLGYLTAYAGDRPNLARPIELWPRLLARRPHVAALYGFSAAPEHHQHHVAIHNARKVLDACGAVGRAGRCRPASPAPC